MTDTHRSIVLREIVEQFAIAMKSADTRRPQAVNPTTKYAYRPGIGPHPEDQAVNLVMRELALQRPGWHSRLRAYDPLSKQVCDWFLGDPLEWVIEIKMARPNGDNGKPLDIAVRDILSPYQMDRSALWDCIRLADSRVSARCAILIYGFDDSRRPLSEIISAFQTLAAARVKLGPLHEAQLAGLVHPVHRNGAVYGWEIQPTRASTAIQIAAAPTDLGRSSTA
jgi:hypothetical protein